MWHTILKELSHGGAAPLFPLLLIPVTEPGILRGSTEAAECYRKWNCYFWVTVCHLKRVAWWLFLYSGSNDLVFKALRFTKQTATKGILPLQRGDRSITSNKAEQAKLLFKGTACIETPEKLSDVPLCTPCRIVYPTVEKAEVGNCSTRSPKKAQGSNRITN